MIDSPASSPTLRWVGVDVAKATFDAALWGDQAFPDMATATFPRTEPGAKALIAWITSHRTEPFGIVLEVTGSYSHELAAWLHGTHVAIVNPALVKAFGRSLALRNKTDRLDARMLARYGQERHPKAWRPLDPTQSELRDLVRTRAKLLHLQVLLRVRLGETPAASGLARTAQGAVLGALQEQLRVLEEAIRSLLQADPTFAPASALLQSIPGVGPVVAATILAEGGDLRRFRRGRQLAAFLGVSPRRHDSGSSVRGRTRMCRVGGTHARTVLYMAAVAASRTQGPLGGFYRHLVAQGKPKRSALGALMRKLSLVMRAVLIQNRPYEPH